MNCSSCRVRGQKSKLNYRHAELGEVKWKYQECSGLLTVLFIFSLLRKGKGENSTLFFSFSRQHSWRCCRCIWGSFFIGQEFGGEAERLRKGSENLFKQGHVLRWRVGRRVRTQRSTLGFFDKPATRCVQMKGQDIRWECRSLGVLFPDFHPSSIFPRGRGIFALL